MWTRSLNASIASCPYRFDPYSLYIITEEAKAHILKILISKYIFSYMVTPDLAVWAFMTRPCTRCIWNWCVTFTFVSMPTTFVGMLMDRKAGWIICSLVWRACHRRSTPQWLMLTSKPWWWSAGMEMSYWRKVTWYTRRATRSRASTIKLVSPCLT